MTESVLTQEMVSEGKSVLLRSGWLPYIGAGLSIAVCYIKAIVITVAPMLGAGWDINPHLQALLMWSFGLLAVIAIYRDHNEHGDRRPFYIAVVGLAVMVGTLYTFYEIRILFFGYFLLLIGTFANQNALLKHLNTQLKHLNTKNERQAAELADWNLKLENRVAEQVAELDRVGQLKRFLSPEVVELVVAQGNKSLLESHRRYVAALFCDLRGFTAFSERAEPEEVIDVLQKYHQVLGPLVVENHGTINHSAGDGLMVIFNDPLPCDEPVRCAMNMAFKARDAIQGLEQDWAKLGHQLGFGIGIAAGYATLGLIGDKTRSDYTAIGNVINLASRLCDRAEDGEILISQRAYLEVEDTVEGEKIPELELKGVSRLQEAYSITHLS